jgi:hypothetical protein
MANGQGVRQLASEVLKPSPNRRAQVALPARRPKSCPYFCHISLTVSPIIWRAPPQQGQSRPLQAHASYRTVAVDHAETEPARRRQALPDQLSREDITFDVGDLLSLAERSRRPGRVGAAPLIISARATSASTSSRHRRSRRAPIDAVN